MPLTIAARDCEVGDCFVLSGRVYEVVGRPALDNAAEHPELDPRMLEFRETSTVSIADAPMLVGFKQTMQRVRGRA